MLAWVKGQTWHAMPSRLQQPTPAHADLQLMHADSIVGGNPGSATWQPTTCKFATASLQLPNPMFASIASQAWRQAHRGLR